MGDPLYAYEMEWVGVVEGKQPTTFSIKTRRQAEINRLIKHRRQLKKQWRKAIQEEKECINPLQGEIYRILATLKGS